MGNANKSLYKGNRIVAAAAVCLAALCIAFVIYSLIPSSNKDINALKSTPSVEMSIGDEMLFADGPGSEDALILYPGAKVDYRAYANLAEKIAAGGVDCFVMKLPLNFAFFNMNAADSVFDEYTYKNYYVGGHSLGAYAAYRYAKNHKTAVSGLVLMGAGKGISLSDKDVRCLAIFGTRDGLVNIGDIEKMQEMNADNPAMFFIEGGNHAQYGTYGKQLGDNEALISGEKQRRLAAGAILEFIR